MLDTLESRLSQAGAGELGHLEFLQALCEDEIARRQAAALVRRVRAARFEATVTLEEFDFGFNPKIPTGLIRDLASLRFLEAGESVILHGPVGVGDDGRPGARAPGLPARALGGVHQDLPAARRPRRRARRPQLARAAAPLGTPGAAHLRRSGSSPPRRP